MENNENKLTHSVIKKAKLFDYLKEELVLSLRLTNTLIKNKLLLVNGQLVKGNMQLNKHDIITIFFEDEINEYEKENIPLEIIYESMDLLIINKPPHIVIHPTKNISSHTIANAISSYFDTIQLKRKIRFVNRLDRDTSGILIVAKNAYSHSYLAKQFESDTISKKYLAIVEGSLKSKAGVIDSKIIKENEKYHVSEDGLDSKTIYKVLKEYPQYSLVLCELKSGRTHQIRVHLSSIGGYLLGDTLYNQKSEFINRQALHAFSLSFIEPRTKIRKTIVCKFPQDMRKLL